MFPGARRSEHTQRRVSGYKEFPGWCVPELRNDLIQKIGDAFFGASFKHFRYGNASGFTFYLK